MGDVAAFLALLPKSVEGRTLRHAIEVRHPSFQDPAFAALAREHGVAIVVAGDSPHPRIDEPTAPFTYARIMGTREGEPAGYPAADLDRWAAWARAQAGGDPPRDVFLFVIGGHKVANPKAAQALIERVA